MDKLSDEALLLSYEKAKKLEEIDKKFTEMLKKEIQKRNLPLEK